MQRTARRGREEVTKPWLLLDCNYLAHRSFHSLGDTLTFNETPTAVIYGFLRDVTILMEEFSTDRVVFAWDFGYGKRLELLPGYKSSRERSHQNDTEEEKQSRSNFQYQVRKLRELYLRNLGFRNVYFQEGYEADDIIASIVRNTLTPDDTAIIVSTDKDLWQLINVNVCCYNPHTRRLLDRDEFMKKWGIEPALWANVKALAGCATDDVPGIRGVGDLTAVKWFRSQLKPDSVAFRKINGEGIAIHNRNIKLVRLPFEGCEKFELVEDCVTPERWREVADRLGMQSLRDIVPGMPRGVRKAQSLGEKKKSSTGFGF